MEQVITSIKQMPFTLQYYITSFRGECINIGCGKLTDRVYQFIGKKNGVAVDAVRACCPDCAKAFYKRVVNIL